MHPHVPFAVCDAWDVRGLLRAAAAAPSDGVDGMDGAMAAPPVLSPGDRWRLAGDHWRPTGD
eukprot:1497193-Prymnesium_polylepis.1